MIPLRRRGSQGGRDARRLRAAGLVLAVLALGALAYSVLQSIVAPALPTLAADLHTSATNATWVLTAFLLSASVLTPVFGKLGDVHGKHRLLVVALALLSLGTLVSRGRRLADA